VQKHIRYHSFGRIIQQMGTLSNRFWYTGREWDGEIGLYFYRARYYDPLVGRFIGEDPIGFSARDANLYRFVDNSPTNFTDPMGAYALAIPAGGSLIIIGIAGVIILSNPEAQEVARELIRRGIQALPIPDNGRIPGDLPWRVPSKTAREGDNYIAKRCRAVAGRNGDPCKAWEAERDDVDEAIKSTRNKAEIKALKALERAIDKAGKQLGCTNKGKREGEKGRDYGSIK
jgi:RHS repeat-associated protein